MEKPKSIMELLGGRGQRLTALKAQNDARIRVLEHVYAALPPNLAPFVVSAGIDNGQLTIGVAGAPWAVRLRYAAEALRVRVAATLGVDIQRIRIKVLPARE